MSRGDGRKPHRLAAIADRPRRQFVHQVYSVTGQAGYNFSLSSELDAEFVMPSIFSDEFPAPTASAEALHVTFPDGAVIEYEPLKGSLIANVEASESITAKTKIVPVTTSQKITLDTLTMECTQHLITKTLTVANGGELRGEFSHCGDAFTSNGTTIDVLTHSGVQSEIS